MPEAHILKFGREKRLLLAWLALLAPIPLPFNKALEWPVLFLYAVVLVYFVQRVEREEPPVLPNWVLNVLGLVYLPFLVFDLRRSFVTGRVVTALIHLIMFLLLAKLFSIKREPEKWHVLTAVFFLFIGGMATSTHMTMSLYLLAFLVLAVVVLARFAYFHAVASRGAVAHGAGAYGAASPGAGEASAVPARLPLVAGTLLVVAIAIPTFATLPRLREPYILGPGGGTGLVRTTGFSDSVDLSLTSSIRSSRDVVLRLQYSDRSRRSGEDLRLKGATYDRWEDRRWHRMQRYALVLPPDSDRAFRLFSEEPVATVEVFRERLSSSSLLVPMETIAVRADFTPALSVDLGGGLFLPFTPPDTVRYQVELAAEPRIRAQLARRAGDATSPASALDPSGITERMRELAREVMGEGEVGERIDRLERYLLGEYTYTTDFVGREGETPVEDFLFTYRSGHCELFATSMVLLLRAEGVPARLAAGYLGAEYNPLEGYFIVRQENAHAWVEAYSEDRGWQVYDPTPPDGRPVVPAAGLKQLLTQLYDYLTFRWDRWVLTFSADDQRGLFETWKEALAAWWKRFRAGSEDEPEVVEALPRGVEAEEGTILEAELWLSRVPVALAAGLFVAAVTLLVFWQRRKRRTAADFYLRLRRHLGRAGISVHDALAPLGLLESAAASCPAAAEPSRLLVGLYLRESFAGETLSDDEHRTLETALTDAVAALRVARRSRNRSASASSA